MRAQKLNFEQQLVGSQAKQSRNTRILQRGKRQSSAFHDGRKETRDARAKLALRIKEKPTKSMAPFPIEPF